MIFKKKPFDTREIARQIIKNTGLDENLGILRQKKHAHPAEPREVLKLVMSLSTVNLAQTLKSDFIVKEIPVETRDGILDDYVRESLLKQDLLKLKGKEIETLIQDVLAIVIELNLFWDEAEDPEGSGPGPRYYCVKEVLKRLGGEVNHALQDALFELMYLQYRHYYRYFQGLIPSAAQEE